MLPYLLPPYFYNIPSERRLAKTLFENVNSLKLSFFYFKDNSLVLLEKKTEKFLGRRKKYS